VLSTTTTRYDISFLYDYTKFLWLFPLKLKSNVLLFFFKIQVAVERQFNIKLKLYSSIRVVNILA
jgi:hypothetical protein